MNIPCSYLQEERIPGFSPLTYVLPEVPVPADQQAPRFDLHLESPDGSDHGVGGEEAARLAPQPVQLPVRRVRSERRLVLRGRLGKAPFVMVLIPQDKSSCIYCLNKHKKTCIYISNKGSFPHLVYFFPSLSWHFVIFILTDYLSLRKLVSCCTIHMLSSTRILIS